MGYIKKTIERSRKKNSRLRYHISSLYDISKPKFIKKLERDRALKAYSKLSPELKATVDKRVTLYNKLTPGTTFNNNGEQIYKLSDLKLHAEFNGRRSRSNYCYDSLKYLRCYNKELKGSFVFGDVSWVPTQPSFVKSRPINEYNKHSIVLALDRIRHFNFIKDSSSFTQKQDMLIGVSYAKQPHRQAFLKRYFGHSLCRLGSAWHFDDERKIWNVEHISIIEQLKYKFILCLEGNDVATNLKWVMSSNSIAVMPKPKFETWFMESTLQSDVHYIEIADDYSDVESKLQYYIDNPDKALQIIEAAHRYIDQFRNKKIEKIISTLVVDKYFEMTNQINRNKNYDKKTN